MSTSITTTKGRFRGDAAKFSPSQTYNGAQEGQEVDNGINANVNTSPVKPSSNGNGDINNTNDTGSINHPKSQNQNYHNQNYMNRNNIHHNHPNHHGNSHQNHPNSNHHSSSHGRPIHQNQSPRSAHTSMQSPHMPHIQSPTHPMPYMPQHYYPYQIMYPSMYVPIYPNEPMYQNHMFMMQQQHYPNIPQQHFKKKENKYASKVSTASNFVPSSMKKEIEEKDKEVKEVKEKETEQKEEKEEHSKEKETKENEPKQQVDELKEPREKVESKENGEEIVDCPATEPKSVKPNTGVKQDLEEANIEFPIFFNAKGYQVNLNRSKASTAKYARLEKTNYTSPVTVVTGFVKVMDYNTGKSTIVDEGKLNPKNEKKEQAPVNWASMLQGKKKIAPAPVVPVTKFRFQEEAFQPLGLLLLKIMCDPNYSVFTDSNEIPTFKVNPRGLTNTGNICYMNSILQVLIYCKSFNKLMRLIKDKAVGSLGASSTPLLDASIKFFSEFEAEENAEVGKQFSEPNKPISPDTFYMNLISHKKFQHLRWGQQEDAEEFLGYYLDGLNEEFLAQLKTVSPSAEDAMVKDYESKHAPNETAQFRLLVKNTMRIIRNEKPEQADEEWNEVGVNKKISSKRTVEIEPTPITMIFGGQFKSVLTIPKSNNSNQFTRSITLDPFQHVQLDISDKASITEGFEHLNEVESISYNNKDKEVEIKKQTFIDNLPEVLIVHLKRFSFHEGIEKLRKKVVYEHNLVIPEKVLSSPENNKYKLIGVVYHHGANAQGGHYTCDVWRSAESGWVRIDDTVLKSISDDEVLNGGADESIKSAYILVYARH